MSGAPDRLTPTEVGAPPGSAAAEAVGPDDAALLRATAAGDAAAYAPFVRRHEAAVFRFVGVLGLSGADAEDALQETFVAAWRGAAGFRADGSARSWLLTIARNAVRHLVRRRVGEPERYEPLESLEQLAERAGWGCDQHVGLAASDAGADGEPDPAAWARATLEAALARLPDAEREILVLRELDGLSGEEAAHVLGLTLAAAKSRLHRARLHLAATLRATRPEGLRE